MGNNEVKFIGFDIYKSVKGLCNQFLGDKPNMTEGENKAYREGIDSALSLLNQILTEMITHEDGSQNIAVHIPDLKTMTEFKDIKEISNAYGKDIIAN